MKVGVMVESFRAGLDGGLQAAAEVGADGVQIYATRGEMSPENMTPDKQKGLLSRLDELGLELAALCGDFGGHGFADPQKNPKRIEDSKKVVDLAAALGCGVVTTHIGVVPKDSANPRYAVMRDACAELAEYGASKGVTFAIETGPEPAAVLRRFLDDIGVPDGLGVNFDPANLVMVCREDIPRAVETLAKYIVHTHAKDGLNLAPVDSEGLYGVPGKEGGLKWGDYIREVPLGEGQVNFETYIPALRKAGFDGYLTIEREVGDNPKGDIAKAVTFLREILT